MNKGFTEVGVQKPMPADQALTALTARCPVCLQPRPYSTTDVVARRAFQGAAERPGLRVRMYVQRPGCVTVQQWGFPLVVGGQ